MESIPDPNQSNVYVVRVYKDGVYSHSVKVLIWPQRFVEELQEIQKKLNG